MAEDGTVPRFAEENLRHAVLSGHGDTAPTSREIEAAFAQWDSDESGKIDVDEFFNYLRSQGMSDEPIKMLLHYADASGDSKIDNHEFATMCIEAFKQRQVTALRIRLPFVQEVHDDLHAHHRKNHCLGVCGATFCVCTACLSWIPCCLAENKLKHRLRNHLREQTREKFGALVLVPPGQQQFIEDDAKLSTMMKLFEDMVSVCWDVRMTALEFSDGSIKIPQVVKCDHTTGEILTLIKENEGDMREIARAWPVTQIMAMQELAEAAAVTMLLFVLKVRRQYLMITDGEGVTCCLRRICAIRDGECIRGMRETTLTETLTNADFKPVDDMLRFMLSLKKSIAHELAVIEEKRRRHGAAGNLQPDELNSMPTDAPLSNPLSYRLDISKLDNLGRVCC